MRRSSTALSRCEAVVIGASAGGVDALCTLLSALPEHLRVPILIVLHLPRNRPSELAEIFATYSACPVREPCDKEPIEVGVAYVAPPDYHMLVDVDARVALSTDEPVHFSRPSIDMLFLSAADVYAEGLLGIILTGGNEDGADGLAAIQQAGGLCVIQEPQGALAPYMPEAAHKRVPTADVLSLQQIADLLHTLRANADINMDFPKGG